MADRVLQTEFISDVRQSVHYKDLYLPAWRRRLEIRVALLNGIVDLFQQQSTLRRALDSVSEE